jgi:multiple sugar transport system permease protein
MKKNEALWGILFATPAIIGFLVWVAGPMVFAAYFSLTDWKIVSTPNFVGLQNYRTMFFEDEFFWKSLSATAYYSFVGVPVTLILAFMVAVMLNQRVRMKVLFRAAFFLPSTVPVVAASMIWMWLYDPNFGLLNYLLGLVGLPGLRWLYSEAQVIPSFILMNVWAMGNTMVVFLAGLQSIPNHYYEAVTVDGGNWYHRFRHITLPLSSTVILFNLIMLIIHSFQVFAQVYIMTEGGPNNRSLFYVFYLFREAFTIGRMGYASALAWVLTIVILILTAIVFKSSSLWVFYQGGKRR